MKRVRIEWSNLWNFLGEHFNQVGSHPNSNVGFFALDKLRQLAMKFMELEELSNFKFQKDFLRPFEEILVHNPDQKIKDMVLACIQQIVQAKSKNLKSGWKSIFNSISKASHENQEAVVILAFDIVKQISRNNLDGVIQNGMFSEYVVCLVEFCKNCKFAKSR
jgi:brefeldin A-inhibited guanine nucleotide-exchange protein